jgi:hypothetical protein
VVGILFLDATPTTTEGEQVMNDRDEFKQWLLSKHGLEATWSEERNCFEQFSAHLAFKAWQAARAKPVDWRDHSKNFAKGETPPMTLESLQAAWERDQEVIDDLRKEISSLKGTVNRLRQAKAKPVVPELLDLLNEMVKLHKERGTVLTVQMEQLSEMLAAAPKP